MIFTLVFSFNFVLTADSHAVVRSNTGSSSKPFTPLLPMVISCITSVQYHNQEIDIDTIHRPYPDFTSSKCICVCVCVCV